jgi:hypothetical protein
MSTLAPTSHGKLAILALLLLLGGLTWWRAVLVMPKDPNAPIQHAPRLGPGDMPVELAKKPLRVLFVGNSYTFMNDLPGMIRHLAASDKNELRLECIESLTPGASLQQHWDGKDALQKLQSSKFDWIVLQEQSLIPASPLETLEVTMYPHVKQFHAAALERKTQPILYMTWGRQKGDWENQKDDSYEAMQSRLIAGYETIAKRLNIPVAPVGVAWRNLVNQQPLINPWSGDGSHPSVAGTYLAACIFYRIFYQKSPVGNPYTASLSASEARIIQEIAERTVAEYRVLGSK